jgi:hypothetical protein
MHRRSVYIRQQPASVILPHGDMCLVKPNAAKSICKGEPMVREDGKFSKAAVARLLDRSGRRIAGYLTKSVPGYETSTATNPAALRNSLKPGDVLLVEGNSRISGVIIRVTPAFAVPFG